MIISKPFSLSLLLISSLAFGRVQLHTLIESKNFKELNNHTIDVTFQCDAHEPVEIYNQDNVKVVVELLTEEETSAAVNFTIYSMHNSEDYEVVSSPVLSINYTDPAKISMGSSNGGELSVIIEAQKA